MFCHSEIAKRSAGFDYFYIVGNLFEQTAALIEKKESNIVVFVNFPEQIQKRFLHTADMHIIVYDK